MPFKNLTVLYDHIHQEHHYTTGPVTHHAARVMMYPLPAPGAVPKKAPIAWEPAQPYKGLVYRKLSVKDAKAEL